MVRSEDGGVKRIVHSVAGVFDAITFDHVQIRNAPRLFGFVYGTDRRSCPSFQLAALVWLTIESVRLPNCSKKSCLLFAPL